MNFQLDKTIKILLAAEFILITSVIFLSLADSKEIPTAYAVKENSNGNTDFKIFTKAVCEEKTEHMFCNDILFVKCNGKEFVIGNNSDNFKCNDLTINLSGYNVNGSGVFKK